MSHQSIYEATCVEYICFHYFWGAKVDTFIESRTTMSSTNRIEMQMPSPCVMRCTTSSNLLASNPFPNKYQLNVSLTLTNLKLPFLYCIYQIGTSDCNDFFSKNTFFLSPKILVLNVSRVRAKIFQEYMIDIDSSVFINQLPVPLEKSRLDYKSTVKCISYN